MGLENLSNILGQETIKKVYEDIASQPAKESSKMLTDLLKTARLFTAPIQLLASYQDRLSKFLDKVRSAVPEENQTEAPPSLSGPILERLKYLEDENYLADLYLNLLSRAIDKERIQEAHPAFFHIIEQLSADEAMILYIISKEPIYYDHIAYLSIEDNVYKFGKEIPQKDTIPNDKIAFPDYFNMYVRHLESLNLVHWKKTKEAPIYDNGTQSGVKVKTQIELSEFGSLFVKACIPKNGFIIIR